MQIDEKEASTDAVTLHDALDMQKPGLYALVERAASFVRQVYTKHQIPTPHADEVLGHGWRDIMYPTGDVVTEEEKKEVREMQKKVAEYVDEDLLKGHLDSFKGTSFTTLVYACALKREAFIIDTLMRRLLDDDQANVPVQGKARTKGKRKVRNVVLGETPAIPCAPPR